MAYSADIAVNPTPDHYPTLVENIFLVTVSLFPFVSPFPGGNVRVNASSHYPTLLTICVFTLRGLTYSMWIVTGAWSTVLHS
ncbi:hypothetical protein BDY19DRAFT_210598 [Irpex rosettiformis]|uniref:Uncharacterized protein n=1 Tax=Irpex rosettiformis TaxID=378272 RepID=A0ACB8U1C3_9APHY|nr:hypothetical protein BDY19DRAFT_210598 [Irpex rosettiformis]